MLKRARLYRQQGYRFPRKATVQLLQLLGASQATIDETVNAPERPEVVAARAARSTLAEHAIELAAVSAAIRDRIEFQGAEPPPRRVVRPSRSRSRYSHPDQLALAL